MREPAYSGQFKKDIRLAQRRGKDLQKIRLVMDFPIQALPIPKQIWIILCAASGRTSATCISSRTGC